MNNERRIRIHRLDKGPDQRAVYKYGGRTEEFSSWGGTVVITGFFPPTHPGYVMRSWNGYLFDGWVALGLGWESRSCLSRRSWWVWITSGLWTLAGFHDKPIAKDDWVCVFINPTDSRGSWRFNSVCDFVFQNESMMIHPTARPCSCRLCCIRWNTFSCGSYFPLAPSLSAPKQQENISTKI